MILTYQKREMLRRKEPAAPLTAKIVEIKEDKARLFFPDGSESRKFYLGAAGKSVGQRVRIVKEFGTYIIGETI